MTLGDIGVAAPPDPTGGPDLVQLLTPEGERVHHPDYPLEISAEEIRDLYRDLVLVRRVDVEATALQRQGELGIWASLLGQEAAQVGLRPRAAARGHGLPELPGARRGLVPRRRPDPAARPLPGHRPRRLGPEGAQLQHLLDRHRLPDAARDRLRDGHPAGRQRGRRDRLLRRRRLQPGRRQRGVRVGERLQRARWSSSAKTTSGRSPSPSRSSPASRSTSGRWASASPASGWTATTCWPAWRSPGPRWTRRGPGRARRSSRPTPTGWARTPPPTTPPATGWPASWRCGGCGTRSSG